MARTKRIDSRTYRIGDYIAFQTDKLDWKLGKPIDWNDPLGAGLIAGTVTFHRYLRDCKSTVARRNRAWKSIQPRMSNYKRS